MSTLWTPSGEHPVPRAPSQAPSSARTGPGTGPSDQRPEPATGGGLPGEAAAGPSQEEVRQAEQDMQALRDELLRAPVEVVISNHAMGLWELAAIHLSNRPPNLAAAQLAIDALTALLEGLSGRLGDAEKTLSDGLTQIRMAFVQITNAGRQGEGQPAPTER